MAMLVRRSPRYPLAVVLTIVFSLPLVAQTTVPVPDVSGPLEVTENSRPLTGAAHYIQPLDLARWGYVEEEFLVSGEANVYEWAGAGGDVRVKTAEAPYVNRILVRRPADAADFSGTVIVELPNTARRFDWPMIFGYSMEYFMEHGDAWVMPSLPATVESLRTFNPDRYSGVSFANPEPDVACPGSDRPPAPVENGLRWDMIAQVAAAVKSGSATRPIPFDVQRVFLASQNTELETFINVFHNRDREGDGSPLYDGYLIKSPGAPAALNNCSRPLASDDPRRMLKGIDAPVIEVLTQGEVLATAWTRRPDSDSPSGRYRRYEIAAAAHIDTQPYRVMPERADQEASSGAAQGTRDWPFNGRCEPEIPLQEFPLLRYGLNGAFANLDAWVASGKTPPHAPLIMVSQLGTDNARLLTNDFGIAEGGIRSPYSDVPTARYHTNSEGPGVCRELGGTHPLSWAELEELYGNHSMYVMEASAAIDRMLAEGFVTASDARRMREELTGEQ